MLLVWVLWRSAIGVADFGNHRGDGEGVICAVSDGVQPGVVAVLAEVDAQGGTQPRGWSVVVAALASLTVLQWILLGAFRSPLQFGLDLHGNSAYLPHFLSSFRDRNLWYIFVWLLRCRCYG